MTLDINGKYTYESSNGHYGEFSHPRWKYHEGRATIETAYLQLKGRGIIRSDDNPRNPKYRKKVKGEKMMTVLRLSSLRKWNKRVLERL